MTSQVNWFLNFKLRFKLCYLVLSDVLALLYKLVTHSPFPMWQKLQTLSFSSFHSEYKMDTSAMNFLCQFPQHTTRSTPRPLPVKKPSHFAQKYPNIKIDTHKRPFKNHRFDLLKPSASDSKDIPLNQLSATTMIKRLYTCVNDKNLKEIEGYISNDCCFEDCSFISPIQGKKEIMQFYHQLITGMGQNVKFCIEHICEDDDFIVGVDWHLGNF